MTCNLPSKKEISQILDDGISLAKRKEEQKGTNCEGELFNYIKGGKEHKVFVKKSFLKGDTSKFEEEYKLLKDTFGNIVPNQSFINNGNDIFAFCSPIDIKADTLLKENRKYLLELLMLKPKLLKQLKFFIRKYEVLVNEGKILDLYGKENLVVSDDDRLYYIDSFLLFQEENRTLKEGSLQNLNYLQDLMKEVEKNNS